MLFRSLPLAALALCACAESDDPRPATFEYISTAILAPSCGTATCHNTMTRREGLALDTIENVKQVFMDRPWSGCVVPGDPCEPAQSELIYIVTVGEPRMPIDSPLPDADIELISEWIRAGAVIP